MKKTNIRTFLVILLCLSLLPLAPALALKSSGSGTVRRGNYEDSGISFKVPDSFIVDAVEAGKKADIIKLVGPKDLNGFIPKLTVKIEAEPYVLADKKADEALDYIQFDLKGSNMLKLVDDTASGVHGDMLRRVIFYNTEDERMGILYLYILNVDGFGVTFEYQAYTATRTLPDEIAALPDIVDSFTLK